MSIGVNKVDTINTCRVNLPDGGVMEIRTSGNINFNEEDTVTLANSNYKLSDFEKGFRNYFCTASLKPGPAAGVK